VQAARAEGGIAGQGQKEADAQDGEDGGDQEELQKAGGFMVSHKVAVEELHGFRCPFGICWIELKRDKSSSWGLCQFCILPQGRPCQVA